MSEKEQPKPIKPEQGSIPKGKDYFEKGQQGIIPPKPPQNPKPNEGGHGIGSPGLRPPED